MSNSGTIFAGALFVALAGIIAAQAPSGSSGRGGRGTIPPLDQVAADRGKLVYDAHCASCHGDDARGTAQGVDLLRAYSVRLDPVGSQLRAFLSSGHKDKTVPSINLTDKQTGDMAMFFRARLAIATSGRGSVAANIVVGNSQDGEQYFNGAGKCNTCHSVAGDLKGIGSKYDATTLQNRIVLPRGRGPVGRGDPPEPETRSVTITLPDGTAMSGKLLTISDFLVQYKDPAGQLHTVTRNGDVPRVAVTDALQSHIDNMRRMTTKQMHDLTAYLVSQK